MQNVAVIGAGYVGLESGACLATGVLGRIAALFTLRGLQESASAVGAALKVLRHREGLAT